MTVHGRAGATLVRDSADPSHGETTPGSTSHAVTQAAERMARRGRPRRPPTLALLAGAGIVAAGWFVSTRAAPGNARVADATSMLGQAAAVAPSAPTTTTVTPKPEHADPPPEPAGAADSAGNEPGEHEKPEELGQAGEHEKLDEAAKRRLRSTLQSVANSTEQELAAAGTTIDTEFGRAAALARAVLGYKQAVLAIDALERGDYVVTVGHTEATDNLPAHMTWMRGQTRSQSGEDLRVTLLIDKRNDPDYLMLEQILVAVEDTDVTAKAEHFNAQPLAQRRAAYERIQSASRALTAHRTTNPDRMDPELANECARALAILAGPRTRIEPDSYRMVRF